MTPELEAKVRELLKGINSTECESEDGWWETSAGADFGEAKLEQLIELLKENWNA